MYNGKYDKDSVTLKEELDRKRFDNENCEAILYKADYYFENKEVADTRVVEFIDDDGQTHHGILSGVSSNEKSPNNLDKYNESDDFFSTGEFWCPETLIPEFYEDYPCEIYIDGRCVNEKSLIEWAKNFEPKILTKPIAEKFFENYCHGQGRMAILKDRGEEYAYDARIDFEAGEEALALKIGSKIDQSYSVDEFEIGRVEDTKWYGKYDNDRLYATRNDNFTVDLTDYVDKEFINECQKMNDAVNEVVEKEFVDNSQDKEMLGMYNGSYDQDYITLKEELERKRLDNEKAEIILYAADYMTPDRNTLESRVIKTVYDDGKEYHNPVKGIYNEELNNLEKFHSLKDVEEECWCAETFVPEELEEMPCEIFLDDKFLNEKALDKWAKNYAEWVKDDNYSNVDKEANEKSVNEKAISESEKEEELAAEEAETDEAIERRYKYEQEYDKRFEEIEEGIENTISDNDVKKADERILKSPPPPVIDGVSIRIEGLDDVTEREAKNYIDLVTKKIQENARKNLSSISIVKKENGQIELDYSVQHERFERIRRITGYLVGSMDKWNNAKRAEEADRVKHTGGSEKNFANDFKDLCGKYGVSPKKAAQFLANDIQKQSQNNMSR